ncbi:MAG: NADH-quinone oxidoreductase subunit NuoH [Proteobacteria bacterium]|nr:NADH-quinone oxidoreductase subunit NuoH [Pseudomonadota bacterium]
MPVNSALFAQSLTQWTQGTWFASVPIWVWALVSALLIIYMLALPFGGLATYVERKIAADIQDRIGPNRVGPLGIFQFAADAIKMISKEDYVPPAGDKFLFNIAPVLVVVGSCAGFVALPLGQYLVAGDINIGVFYIMAVTTIIAPGILLGSWASENKWSLLGGLRSAAQIVSYEIPVALSIVPIVLISGSLQIGEIVKQQGWNEHFWNVFHNPFTLISFFILFVGGLAETNRIPFDLPEAESELVSGFNTEFSGMRFGLYALGEFVDVFVMCALVTSLYLGGWQLPFLELDKFWITLPSGLIALIHVTFFLGKTFLLVFVVMWLRWTLPRLRVDQLMGLCWKGMVPIALFNILGTAIWMWAFKGHSMFQVVSGLFSSGGGSH